MDLCYDGTGGDPTVIAYDPGGVTGWSLFSVHPDALTDPECLVLDNVTHWACGEFNGDEYKLVDQMLQLADDWPGAALLTEDFVPQQFNQSRAFLAPVRLNAAFAYEIGRERRVWYQLSSLAMLTITDARLRSLGRYWHDTEGMKDARAATKHALTFLKRLKTQPKLLKQAFPNLGA